MYRDLTRRYKGDWMKVMEHIRVHRFLLSEKDRVGIGTFQPKDEKNQDSTELTGDINYRKIAIYGSDSDARAFNFDGEFNVANRGIIEFIEVLKLEVAFLYDLLGASQEHKIKPKKFPQTDIDEVIIGHTNEPEYRKLQNNEFMEALRDRTVKIDIPYITKLADEIMNASRTNRELLQHFVTVEVDKAAARLGFARAEEVEALREEIASLRTQLSEATVRAGKAAATKKTAKKAPARKTAATMTATKKSTATKSPGRKPPRKKAATAERSS